MKAWLLLIFILIALLQFTSAATVKGIVYDFGFEEAEAIVEINSSPPQKMVAKSSFEFHVPLGDYTIIASQYNGLILEAKTEEVVEINEQGVFTRDLILFPEVGVDELDIEDPIEENFNYGNNRDYFPQIITLILIATALVLYFETRDKKSKAEGLDKEAAKVLAFIGKKKRVTQREIRKEFPHSEAKISLIITELENKNLIKKIKKGRGNVIIKQ